MTHISGVSLRIFGLNPTVNHRLTRPEWRRREARGFHRLRHEQNDCQQANCFQNAKDYISHKHLHKSVAYWSAEPKLFVYKQQSFFLRHHVHHVFTLQTTAPLVTGSAFTVFKWYFL